MTYLYAAPAHSSVTRARWEPMPLQPDHMLAGNPHPRVHWLRKNKPGQTVYIAGLWEVQPATFRWIFTGNESFYILHGRATITTDEGVVSEV